MLVSALAVTPIAFAMYADNLWLAVAIIGVATTDERSTAAPATLLPDTWQQARVKLGT